ncbi:MAG: PEGA domain-containing protein [Methanomicrobiales archaeon]|nr:PEGA domain-containing protein [Methanomicrobiales archaeon]
MRTPGLLFFLILFLCSLVAAAGAEDMGGDVGYYQIDSSPSGGEVHFDGQYRGTTPVTVEVYTTGPPGHTVSVSLTGYRTWTQNLPGNPAAGETVPVTASLEPLEQYGSVYVTTTPTGAAIYLNGNYRGTAPLTLTNVRPGTYTIEADLEGYDSASTSDTVVAGQQLTEYFPLKKIVRAGSVSIISEPASASIFLDGDYQGRTPLTLTKVSPGTHTIELDAASYYDWKTTVVVAEGSDQTVRAILSAIPSSTTGWIQVASIPAGATIRMDSVVQGQTPPLGVYTIQNVPAGDHMITLQLSGYQDYSTTVNVRASTTSHVSASLQSAPSTTPVPEGGGVSVSSVPSGGNVFVDNVYRGVTPVTLTGIPAGTHTIRVQLQGYRDFAMEVQVVGGTTTPVTATLEMVATPAPTKSGLPPFAAAAGVLMAGLLLFLIWRTR